MKRDLAAGIDSSTQSCTVVLRSLDDGAFVAEARALHPTTTPPCSEQDPRAWWVALRSALEHLAEYLPRIATVSVGGQGHGLVLLGKDDDPLRPAKLWNDTEAAYDANRLCQLLSPSEWARRMGSVPGPAMTISKLAWTERRHPGLVGKAHHVMLPFDYIVYRLSRNAVTERGGASGSGYFNPFANCWDTDLATLAVPDIDWFPKLPQIIGSSDRAGLVAETIDLGPMAGAVVGAGTGDNMTAALGIGVKDGDTVISLGTSGTIYAVTPVETRDETGTINGFADATGRNMPMVTTLNAAKVTDTFRRLLGLSTDSFDELALACPPGANGLVVVPYLDGERTPNLPNATGTIRGLRTDMTPAHMARAVVEGVLCNLLEGGDRLKSAGIRNDGRLILTGGAARSRAYRQILADLTGRSVWISPMVESAAAGAAVQATAALTGSDIRDISESWALPLECVAEPAQERAACREDVRAAYRKVAKAVDTSS